MSTNIVPFESLAAFPVSADASDFDLNIAGAEFASAGFPVISTKAGRFHTKNDGTRTLITRIKNIPSDPDEPATYIDMVILNLQKAKTFYLNGYTEGSEEKPDCVSNDGVTPDVSSQNKQCDTCALCPHNAWGSGTNDKGEATKGKACSDNLRLAVASPASLDEAYLLRVSPASLKNFSEMVKFLTARRVPVNRAVVRIAFDTSKTGILTFQAIGGLDEATYAKANSLKNADVVLSITGKSAVGIPVYAAPTQAAIAAPAKAALVGPTAEEVAAADAAKKKAEAKAKKVAAAKAAAEAAAAAAAAAEDDDEEDEVVAQPEPVKQAGAKVATSDNFDAELAALIG